MDNTVFGLKFDNGSIKLNLLFKTATKLVRILAIGRMLHLNFIRWIQHVWVQRPLKDSLQKKKHV